jgi:hypothetical protein
MVCSDDAEMGEATEAFSARDVCIAAVTFGAALGCAAATLACEGTAFLTAGATMVPCNLVLIGACVVGPAGAGVYAATLCEGK